MAVYSTDFSEYTTGVDLSDWTDFWSASGFTYHAESNSGSYKVSTKWLEFDASTSVRRVLTWDDVGSVADVDILTKVKIGSVMSSDGPRIFARVGGTSGNEEGYFLVCGPSSFEIIKYVSGTPSLLGTVGATITANKEFWVRFRVNGTDLKARVWSSDTVEPNDWTIETTDSSLSSGNVGVGQFYSTQDFYCDFFECVTGGGSATYPPSGFTYNDAFSNVESLATSGYLATAKCMGGQFIDSSRKLKGVGVYCTDHSDDIRVAVYSGGSLSTGPAGATLLKDFGKTSGSVVNDYVTIFTTDDIDVPSATPLWIVIKGDNVAGFEFTFSGLVAYGHHGNFQIARGRGDVTTQAGNDPDVSFASTFPAGTTSFANYWYDLKIYLDGHPDVPVLDSTTVGVAIAIAAGTNAIDVAMPYTDDNNGDNTYTVDYKLASEPTTWTNWVTGATHTTSPYETTITGLDAGGLYDVKCTYIDPDGVTGTNPQEIDDIQLADPLNGTDIIMIIL